MDELCNPNFDLHNLALNHAHAAIMVSAFFNGAVGTRLPYKRHWIKALNTNPQNKLLLEIVANPGVAKDNERISSLHSVYRHSARLGNFSVEHGILYMKDIFENNIKYIKLFIVPSSLYSIVFVAFHANPICGHLGSLRIFHCVCQSITLYRLILTLFVSALLVYFALQLNYPIT